MGERTALVPDGVAEVFCSIFVEIYCVDNWNRLYLQVEIFAKIFYLNAMRIVDDIEQQIQQSEAGTLFFVSDFAKTGCIYLEKVKTNLQRYMQPSGYSNTIYSIQDMKAA